MKKALAWHVAADGIPTPLKPGFIDLEKHLEDWIDRDPDIVADDVLLIGRQLKTHWGTILDLLAIDEEGYLVILELKRDQTLRETVAQSLEYAAWASKLGYEAVVAYGAARYGSPDAFRAAFEGKFGHPLPAALNTVQRVLVVAPSIDDATSDVIDYLSNTYRLPMNAVSFDVFGETGNQVIVRHFVMEGDDLPQPVDAKVKSAKSMEDAMAQAEEAGIRDHVEKIAQLSDLFKWSPWVSKTGWTWYLPAPSDINGVSALRVIIKPGALRLTMRPDNLAGAFGKPLEAATAFINAVGGGRNCQPLAKGSSSSPFPQWKTLSGSFGTSGDSSRTMCYPKQLPALTSPRRPIPFR